MPIGIYKHTSHSALTRLKMSLSHKGKKHTSETLEKLRGKNHHSWVKRGLSYQGVHTWIRRTHGGADHCESKTCNGKSKVYNWCLLKGRKYTRNIKNFKQMCRSCHIKYDKRHPRKRSECS